MKFSIIILVSITIHHAYCSKNLKFISLNDCSSKNTVIEIEKCEIDNVYASVKFNLKTPIVKSDVSYLNMFYNERKVDSFTLNFNYF